MGAALVCGRHVVAPLLAPGKTRSDEHDGAPASEPLPDVMPTTLSLKVVYTELGANTRLTAATTDPASMAKTHRRIVRLISMAACMLLLVGVLLGVHLMSSTMQITRVWDPSQPFTIDVSSCDVHVTSAPRNSEPTVTFSGVLASTPLLRWMPRRDGISGVIAHSSKSCATLPYQICAIACQVTLRVPEGVTPKLVHVYQDLDDIAPIVQVRVDDVTLQTLRVRGAAGLMAWSTAGPTVDVRVRRSRFLAGLEASLVNGDFRCDECEVLAKTNVAAISQRGSVSLDAVVLDRPPGSEVWLGVRQPMDYVCLAVEAVAAHQPVAALPAPDGAAAEPDGAAAAEPEMGRVSIEPSANPWEACSGTDYWWKGAFALYDSDHDGFVNRKELLDGFETLPICCGASCPYAGWCDPRSWEVFPSVLAAAAPQGSGFEGRADILTNAAFLRKLQAMNATYAVPRCVRWHRVRQEAPPPAIEKAALPELPLPLASEPEPAPRRALAEEPPPPIKWPLLIAEAGQVRVVVRAPGNRSVWSTSRSRELEHGVHGPSNAWPPLSLRGENRSASFYAPDSRLPGLRMLHFDAKRLRERVGARFGDQNSRETAYIVFDVPAAPGVPASLWVYSPLPVFFVLGPSTLALLSLGTMVPPLLRFRVRFHDAGCDSASTEGRLVRASCAASFQFDELPRSMPSSCEEWEHTDRLKRLGEIHRGLTQAILSNGRDSRKPRGQLLLVQSGVRPQAAWWEFLLLGSDYALSDFTSVAAAEEGQTPEVVVSAFSAPVLSATLHLAVVMSLLASLVVALGAQAALYLAARETMRTAWRDKQSKARMFSKFGLSALPTDGVSSSGGGAKEGAQDKEGKEGRRKDGRKGKSKEPSFNVFEVPLVFVSTLLVEPLQRQYIESVSAFIRDRCLVEQEGWVAQAMGSLKSSRTFAALAPDSAGASASAQPAAKRGWFRRGAPASAPVPQDVASAIAAATAAAAPASEAEPEVASPPTPGPVPRTKLHMPMADFSFQYELYCFQRGLEVVSSREALQRLLIRKFNCRVHSSAAVLYQGCRWREPRPGPPVATLKPTRAELGPEYVFSDFRATIAAFVAQRLLVDRDPASAVPEALDSEEAAEGEGGLGFISELRAFCELNGRREPSNVAVLYELSLLGVTITHQNRRTLYGARTDKTTSFKLSWDRTAMEVVAVALHASALFLPGLVLLAAAVYSQEVYAQTTTTRMPLLWQHFFARSGRGSSSFWLGAFLHPDGGQVSLAVRLEILELCVFGVASAGHMLAHYLDMAASSPVLRRSYGAILWLHTLLLLLHLSLVLTWSLLAAVLDPNRFLPAGTAIVVALVVVTSTRGQLGLAAAKLRKALTDGFEKRLEAMLQRAMEAGQEEKLHRQAAEVRQLGLSASQLTSAQALLADEAGTAPPKATLATTDAGMRQSASLQGQAKVDSAKKLMPSDVFALLASSASGGGTASSLDAKTFEELFAKLDLDISRARREQLFAYMDMNSDGRINQKEFEDGWDFLVTLLVEEAVDSAGVSPGQITIAVCGLILWLVFVFSFIFLAVQGWLTAGPFEAAVQSMFVALMGFLSQRMRTKTAAEKDDKEFTAMVNGFVNSPTSGKI